MTPIHLDPEHPPMPISHPPLFSNYLAKSIGPFGTLGLIEDTSALNDGALDQQGFLHQAWQAYAERKEMFLRALETRADDLLVCVFDTPDRIQHMFWRQHRDPNPSDVIEQMMIEVDDLLGQTMSRLSPETLLLVISDHGFTHYDRSVNLNAWLHQHGYLHLLPGATPAKDWLEGVDWSRTRAYALGLTGIYINLQGRESSGIVSPGPEYDALVAELKSALEDLRDPANDPGNAPNESSDSRKCSTSSKPRDLSLGPSMSLASASGRTHLGQHAIRRVLITNQHYSGPYRLDGPDLIIGYEAGYRCSWECARGQVTDTLFADNNRPWSGDHCVDPELVPGVLLSNMPFGSSNPRILDIAPTILDYLGITPPDWMGGQSLLQGEPPATRPIFSAYPNFRVENEEKMLQLDLSKIKPPFYQFGIIGMAVCQKWYSVDTTAQTWKVEEIAGYPTPCEANSLPSDSQAQQMILQQLQADHFDVSSLKTRLDP
jgi:hypothetical protein